MFTAGVIWTFLVVGATGLLGLAVAIGEHPPRDGLHVVYGLLGAATLPGAFVVASGRTERQRSLVWAIAGIVMAILVLRLFQTGG
jgi:hypothetical protein